MATKCQVRTFLGLVGYYRQFVPQFASIAAPLHKLTAKNQPNQVQWTAETEAAFQQLKTTLCTGPVLATPDFTKQFVLQTDASEVFIQKDERFGQSQNMCIKSAGWPLHCGHNGSIPG